MIWTKYRVAVAEKLHSSLPSLNKGVLARDGGGGVTFEEPYVRGKRL